MHRLLIFLIFLLISTVLCAQSTEMIVPFSDEGKWGFMNIAKEIVVSPQFEEAYPSPSSGRYRVKLKGKYGFIDGSGKMLIKNKYDEAHDFRYGIAEVTLGDKVFYIKKDGSENEKMIALCGNHSGCTTPKLSENIHIYKENNKYGIVNNELKRYSEIKRSTEPDTIRPAFDSIVPISYRLMYLIKDDRYAFLRISKYWGGAKKVGDNLKFDFEDVKLFPCSFCLTGKDRIIGIKKNGLWGYKKLYFAPEDFIEPKYISIESLADGFALVEYEKDKFGYIDQQGNEYFIR